MTKLTAIPIFTVLIPVTKNEAECLSDTLESIRKEILNLDKLVEIIVIANCCKGTSDKVAKKIFMQKKFQNNLIKSAVINCETAGKMFAVNDGIEVSRGQYLILMDGDLILDKGSLTWTLDTLQQKDTTVVSMHHAPIDGTLPKDNDLAKIIQMNAIRRHAYPEKYWLHGAYLGWSSELLIEGKPLRFPEGKRIHEDNWLTAMIARDYGFKTMKVTLNYMARFIPPQNWDDYYKQQWRYQFAHVDLSEELPELSEYIPMIRKWTFDKYPNEWVNRMWREACIREGIDFDSFESKYYEVLEKVRNGRNESKNLLNSSGVWVQQVTTKHNPKKST